MDILLIVRTNPQESQNSRAPPSPAKIDSYDKMHMHPGKSNHTHSNAAYTKAKNCKTKNKNSWENLPALLDCKHDQVS